MTARTTLATLSVLTVALVSALLGASASGGATAATPDPTGAPITVIIPDLSGSASPTPTPTPTPTSTAGTGGGNHGGSNNGGGNSGGGTGGGVTPTNPDGSPIPPKKPGKNKPALVLDHSARAVGELLTATGTGFGAGERVQFVLYPGAVVIGSVAADANGTVTVRFRIPDKTATGDHVLEATGWTSAHVANKAFTVTSSVQSGLFPLWWVYVVVGVLLLSLISALIHFRSTIAGWFGAAVAPAGQTS